MLLDNTFCVCTLSNIMIPTKPLKVFFQSGMSNFLPSPIVLGSLSGQQFQQILPRYQSCYPIYLGKFKYIQTQYLAGIRHSYGESWQFWTVHTYCLNIHVKYYWTVLFIYGFIWSFGFIVHIYPYLCNSPYIHQYSKYFIHSFNIFHQICTQIGYISSNQT